MRVSEKKFQNNGIKSLSPGRQQSFPQKHKVSKKKIIFGKSGDLGKSGDIGSFFEKS